MNADLKIGDLVEARAGTLARFYGDRWGTVEVFDGTSIMVRMDNSGWLVPFARDQLDAIHRPLSETKPARGVGTDHGAGVGTGARRRAK